LGLATINPSTRTIAGPSRSADVEPRVMQVLVVLADAAGEVVTRTTLFNRCWGGVYVGDDSLNRVIGAIRKLAAEVAENSFEVEIRTEDAGPPVLRKLEEAVAIRPRSARAWGLLSFFNIISAQFAGPKEAAPMIVRAQEAARRAFSIDRKEPNALLAMYELEG